MSQSDAIQKFLVELRRSLADGTFVNLQLTGAASPSANIQRMDARLIHLKGQNYLSFTTREVWSRPGSPPNRVREQTLPAPDLNPSPHRASKGDAPHEPGRVVTKNFPMEDGIRRIGENLATDFRNALLRTLHRDWQLHRPAKGNPKLVGHKASTTTPPSRQHDQPRNTLVGDGARDWLQALGLSDATNRPKPSMADKYRQISRYTEILHHLARDCGWTTASTTDAPVLNIADVGCGKGYLTFAAWHLFHRVLHQPVSIRGVETRRHLVAGANRVARRVNADGLGFVAGDIASVRLPRLDALIALHACNTATDDAIRRGIELDARLIVVAPCCHQALRPELGSPEPFTSLLRHGLFKERLAEWLTDGLRTLFLEWAGYQSKVIEFVASEHTAKNLMIAAIRKWKPFTEEAARARILDLKRFFGIKHHALDNLLNPHTSEKTNLK